MTGRVESDLHILTRLMMDLIISTYTLELLTG